MKRVEPMPLGRSPEPGASECIAPVHVHSSSEAFFELLTAGEVAKEFRCSKQTIWRWVRMGRLAPPIRICGIPRWKKRDLQDVVISASAHRDHHRRA